MSERGVLSNRQRAWSKAWCGEERSSAAGWIVVVAQGTGSEVKGQCMLCALFVHTFSACFVPYFVHTFMTKGHVDHHQLQRFCKLAK